VTLPQVHAAANALIDALPLPPKTRCARLQHIASKLQYWQARNVAARRSHVKRRKKLLRQLGIRLSELPRCDPG
jgi:hypothetical protein